MTTTSATTTPELLRALGKVANGADDRRRIYQQACRAMVAS